MANERQAQARAEAARRHPGQSSISQMKREEFMRGWLAADANQKPHTITRAEFLAALETRRGDGLEDTLGLLGIEVTDE